MTGLTRIPLPGRSLIRLAGADRVDFLNGLVSNDVRRVGPDQSLYAALLTPQGRFLADMFIAGPHEALWLDVAAAHRDGLLKKLQLYRLRARVEIAALDWRAYALIGEGVATALGLAAEPGASAPRGEGFALLDPRLAAMGARLWLPPAAEPDLGMPGAFAAYEDLRLDLGLPDGAQDIEVDRGLLLEHHFEALHGVDFRKGCYVGQEVTTRSKHRGLVKKLLYRVGADAPLPAPGSPLMQGDQEAGILRSVQGRHGLALLRRDAVEKASAENAPITADGIAIRAALPDYALETANAS